ncbi:MAG: hypothetical protein HQ472_04875 [Ignavibacteria bacterium]|nr:hypothetical protein [Ignavibacteria bacterium]
MMQATKPLAKIALVIVLLFGLHSCVLDFEPVETPAVDYNVIAGTRALDAAAKKVIIDGVYEVDGASKVKIFGNVMTVKLAENGDVNMYTTVGVVYFRMRGGMRSDTAVFAGYWRGVQGPQTGAAYFVVLPDEGGTQLSSGVGTKDITIRALMNVPNGQPDSLILRRKQDLKDDSKGFQIIAHRGGGRNSERLGVSENTIEMVKLATHLGATGVEIDVRRSMDGIPIVFHDPTFTPRTVRGAYIIGAIENYTYKQMTELAILINGEKIPTFEALLKAAIDETSLTFVWVDMKDETITDKVLKIIKDATDYAAIKNRDIRIVYGIPTQEVLDAYYQSPLYGTVETLCELGAADAIRIKAAVFGQRFTEGVQRATVEPLRDAGMSAYVWTLDDEDFISTYLQERYTGKGLLYNGILTNYPTLLASKFYAAKYKPK